VNSPKPPPLQATAIAFIGGVAGTLVRIVSTMLGEMMHTAPWIPTLAVNIVASFLAGFIGRYLLGHLIGRKAINIEVLDPREVLAYRWSMLWVTGFCGGLSTFSAFGLEMGELARAHNLGEGMLVIALSLSLGISAAWCGLRLGMRLNHNR